MRTYYRGPDAVVTELRFVRHQPDARFFLIDDLDNIRLLRTGAGGPSGSEVAVALGLLSASAATWYSFGPMAGAPVTAVAAVLAITTLRLRHRREWQIRATYHGHEVKLYACTDSQTFNQVARGLRRSIEGRTTRHRYGLTAG
jgi:hypothetical protein